MKSNRKFSSLIVLLFITIMLSTTVEAQRRGGPFQRGARRGDHQTEANPSRDQLRTRGHSDAVGAPLDGGLLALLAGAGITYFAARKKKKKLQE